MFNWKLKILCSRIALRNFSFLRFELYDIYDRGKYYWCTQNAKYSLVHHQIVFTLLRYQYGIFHFCSLFSYRSSNFAIATAQGFIRIAPHIVITFLLLKVIANSNENLFGIANKSDKERQQWLLKKSKEMIKKKISIKDWEQ